MIYAQRPDATAAPSMTCGMTAWAGMCGAVPKGIALVDDSGDRPRLRYVSIFPTPARREHSRSPLAMAAGGTAH